MKLFKPIAIAVFGLVLLSPLAACSQSDSTDSPTAALPGAPKPVDGAKKAAPLSLPSAYCVALTPTTIVATAGPQVQAKAGENVVAVKGSYVWAEQGSHVDACDGSIVIADYGSTVTAYSGSRVDAYDGTLVTAEAGSHVVTENAGLVIAKPGSKVEVEIE